MSSIYSTQQTISCALSSQHCFLDIKPGLTIIHSVSPKCFPFKNRSEHTLQALEPASIAVNLAELHRLPAGGSVAWSEGCRWRPAGTAYKQQRSRHSVPAPELVQVGQQLGTAALGRSGAHRHSRYTCWPCGAQGQHSSLAQPCCTATWMCTRLASGATTARSSTPRHAWLGSAARCS